MAFPEDFLSNLAASFSTLDSVLISLLVSTVAGGIIFLIVVELIAKKLHDRISIPRVFLAVFIINIATLPIIFGVTSQALGWLPFASAILPFLPFIVWLAVIELLFKDIPISHSFILSLVGYILSILVVPAAVIALRGILSV